MQKVISQQGDTVDLICWRHRGRTAAITEQVLALNPGLSEIGPVLPAGISIALPDVPATPVRQTVKLWD